MHATYLELDFVPVEGCYACGLAETVPAFERTYFGSRFRWVRCSRCRLVYQNPKLTRDSLCAVYNSDVYWNGSTTPGEKRLGYTDYVQGDVYRLRQAKVRLAWVRRFLPAEAHLLDVACATGFFVKVTTDLGLAASGVELSRDMAQFGREHYGVSIETADFDTFPIEPASLDAVTIWGSDSNFFNPRETFRKVHRILRPGGMLFFNFWDFDHFTRPLRGEFKMAYNALYNFNSRNVRLFLRNTGFETLASEMEWQYATLDAIFSFTDQKALLSLVRRLGWSQKVVHFPTLSGYLVAARKA